MGTKELTDSFTWGLRGGEGGQGWFRPHAGGTPPPPLSGVWRALLLGGSDPILPPGEWTAGAGSLDTGWAGSCARGSARRRPWHGPGMRALWTVILGFKASRREQAIQLLPRTSRPPTSPSEVPRSPPGSSDFRFLGPAFHLIASFPASDSAVSPLCSHRSLPFQSPQLSFQRGWRGSRFNTQMQSPLFSSEGANVMGHWRAAPAPLQWGPWALPFLTGPPSCHSPEGCFQTGGAHKLPTPLLHPPVGKASHPVQADSRTWAYPAYGPGGLQRKLILTVSPHSSALPDSPPSIPHPQIPVR